MAEDQLFDYVLVVSLKNENKKPVSYLDYRFPPNTNKDKKDNLVDSIVQFCYPEAEQWVDPKIIKSKKNQSESFSFVLTEADGARKFGYCRRFVTKGKTGEYKPECFVILSLLPSASLFNRLLDIVEQLRKKSSSAVFSFLKSVLAKSFPQPGETLKIRTFEEDDFIITRSDNDFMLDFVSFRGVFKKLGIDTVLDIFAAAITESRLIICSQNIETLSDSFHAISGLIYPFTWQHIYIPILPKTLVSYCCAPMPFMVGVLKSNLNELNQYPLEELVMIDMETKKYLKPQPPTCNYKKVLPSGLASILKKEIEKILKSGKNTKAIDLGISQAFLNFLYNVFGNYESFLKNHVLDRDSFIKSKSNDIQKFIEQVAQTQMFEMWIKEKEDLSKNNKLATDVLSSSKFGELISKTNEAILEVQDIVTCSICDKRTDELITKKGKLMCLQCSKTNVSKREKLKSMMIPKKKDKKEKEDKSLTPSIEKKSLTSSGNRDKYDKSGSARASGNLNITTPSLRNSADNKSPKNDIRSSTPPPKPEKPTIPDKPLPKVTIEKPLPKPPGNKPYIVNSSQNQSSSSILTSSSTSTNTQPKQPISSTPKGNKPYIVNSSQNPSTPTKPLPKAPANTNTSNKPKFCRDCGKENKSTTALFCGECGSSLK